MSATLGGIVALIGGRAVNMPPPTSPFSAGAFRHPLRQPEPRGGRAAGPLLTIFAVHSYWL